MRLWPLAAAALLAATVASYAPVFDAGFVNYDDMAYVQHNEHVSGGLKLAEVRWALTGYESSNWHPLTWISHMVDVELFGFEPRGPHVVNLVLHVLNVALLFGVLRSLTGDPLPSFGVAALFALHPANVESVAWIAQRKTLLCALFMLLSIGAYASWVRGGGLRRYLASLGLFGLAMASKPMIVTFPFALLLLDWWPLRRAAFAEGPDGRVSLAGFVRGFLRLVPEKLPFFALCGVLALITLDAQQNAMSPLEKYTLESRLSNVAISYVGYLGTFAWPDRLAVFYPLYPERQTAAEIAGCAALLAALTAAAVFLGLRRRHLLFGWFWYLGTLVPVIGLVQVGAQSMADRYVYIPFWGLACAVAWSLAEALRARPLAPPARAAAAALAVAALAVLGTLTYRQSAHWKDGLTLFSSALANTEDNYLAHSVLAERFYADSEFERSIEHSVEAAKSHRNMGAVRSTYGLALYNLGRRAEALEQFKLAAEQEPDNPLGYMNLGWFEAERGRYDQALADLATAAARIWRRRSRTRSGRPTRTGPTRSRRRDGSRRRARSTRSRWRWTPRTSRVLRDAARIDLQLRDPERATARLRRVAGARAGRRRRALAPRVRGAARGRGRRAALRARARARAATGARRDRARADARQAGARRTRPRPSSRRCSPSRRPPTRRMRASSPRTRARTWARSASRRATCRGAMAELDRALAVDPDELRREQPPRVPARDERRPRAPRSGASRRVAERAVRRAPRGRLARHARHRPGGGGPRAGCDRDGARGARARDAGERSERGRRARAPARGLRRDAGLGGRDASAVGAVPRSLHGRAGASSSARPAR